MPATGVLKKNPRRRSRHNCGRGMVKSGKPPVVTVVVRKTGKAIFLVFENLRGFSEKFRARVGHLVEGRLKVFTDEYFWR